MQVELVVGIEQIRRFDVADTPAHFGQLVEYELRKQKRLTVLIYNSLFQIGHAIARASKISISFLNKFETEIES